MNYYELTNEEQEISNAVENGEFVSISNFKEEKKKFLTIARRTLNKTKYINIRLSEKDLACLKRKAIDEGIPYQSLTSSIHHKYSSE